MIKPSCCNVQICLRPLQQSCFTEELCLEGLKAPWLMNKMQTEKDFNIVSIELLMMFLSFQIQSWQQHVNMRMILISLISAKIFIIFKHNPHISSHSTYDSVPASPLFTPTDSIPLSWVARCSQMQGKYYLWCISSTLSSVSLDDILSCWTCNSLSETFAGE